MPLGLKSRICASSHPTPTVRSKRPAHARGAQPLSILGTEVQNEDAMLMNVFLIDAYSEASETDNINRPT